MRTDKNLRSRFRDPELAFRLNLIQGLRSLCPLPEQQGACGANERDSGGEDKGPRKGSGHVFEPPGNRRPEGLADAENEGDESEPGRRKLPTDGVADCCRHDGEITVNTVLGASKNPRSPSTLTVEG